MGKPMYRPEIDKVQRDRCYTCKGTGGKPPIKYAEPHGSKERVEEQLRIALNGHSESELWGEHGLIAATMRCVEAVNKIEDLVTTDHETKESFIQRVRGIISLPNVNMEARPDGASNQTGGL